MENTEAQSAPIDNRLICNCGEIGTVKECGTDEGGGFRVFCRRDGAPCCMSFRGDTPDEAMDAFEDCGARLRWDDSCPRCNPIVSDLSLVLAEALDRDA